MARIEEKNLRNLQFIFILRDVLRRMGIWPALFGASRSLSIDLPAKEKVGRRKRQELSRLPCSLSAGLGHSLVQ